MPIANAETVPVWESLDVAVWPPVGHDLASMPWWQNDQLITGLYLLGFNVLIAGLLGTLLFLFSRRLLSEFQKSASLLSAIAKYLDAQSNAPGGTVAAAVHGHMSAAYFQELIAAVQQAMSRNGFAFGRDARSEVHMPPAVVRAVCKDLVKAQLNHLYPLDTDIDARIEQDEKTGYSEKFVRGIIAAMREQGKFVEKTFDFPAR